MMSFRYINIVTTDLFYSIHQTFQIFNDVILLKKERICMMKNDCCNDLLEFALLELDSPMSLSCLIQSLVMNAFQIKKKNFLNKKCCIKYLHSFFIKITLMIEKFSIIFRIKIINFVAKCIFI
jgi:hypothetical protein